MRSSRDIVSQFFLRLFAWVYTLRYSTPRSPPPPPRGLNLRQPVSLPEAFAPFVWYQLGEGIECISAKRLQRATLFTPIKYNGTWSPPVLEPFCKKQMRANRSLWIVRARKGRALCKYFRTLFGRASVIRPCWPSRGRVHWKTPDCLFRTAKSARVEQNVMMMSEWRRNDENMSIKTLTFQS